MTNKMKTAYIILFLLGTRTNDSNTINREFIGAERNKHFTRVMLQCAVTADIAPSCIKERSTTQKSEHMSTRGTNVGWRGGEGKNTCMSRIATLTGTGIRIPDIR